MYARITGFLLAFALAVTGLAAAQERFGALTGRVTDQQGAVVPGVTVTTVNTQTGESRVFVSGADGMFRAPDLVPGRYTVRFELSGFTTVERADVLVMLGREFEIDTQLGVGAQTETVQVVGEATPLVDTRSTLIGHNVSAEEFDRLPKGRSFQSIAFSAPSVSQGEVEGGFQVNGASGAENSFTVDGIVTNSLVNGAVAPEHGVRVPAGSPGQDERYLGRVRRRPRRRRQRGHQERRQHLPRRSALLLRGQRARGRPGERLVLDPLTERTGFYVQDEEQIEQDQRDGRLDRRPDRPRSPLLLRRLLAAEPEARPTTTSTATAPATSTAASGRSRPSASCRSRAAA